MRKKFTPLTDSQWQVMAEFLPLQRKRELDLRNVVNAIRWINETGCQWRNLPETFPEWSAVYYYFRKWKHDGTLRKMNIGLNILRRAQVEKAPTPSLVCIDSQSVKLAPFVFEERGADGNNKINGRKRQVLVDTLGLVWGVVVHAANGSDSIYGGVVIKEIKDVLQRVKKILVDKGYEGVFLRWRKKTSEFCPRFLLNHRRPKGLFRSSGAGLAKGHSGGSIFSGDCQRINRKQ